jgi:hypothetical protein
MGNIAVGNSAMKENTSGVANTAIGLSALYKNRTGSSNVAIGASALSSSLTGTDNIAIGLFAGSRLMKDENYNIDIGNEGIPGESSTVRIGDSTLQKRTFIAGISGVNISGVPVLVSNTGQLGVASSSRRFKQDIQDMGDASDSLMRLRPVTYRYMQPLEDGSQPLQYGLIAEEVEKVYPELVARSADGKIESVKYQLLDSMLLNEVQKLHAQNAAQRGRIQSLEERLLRLESLLQKQ